MEGEKEEKGKGEMNVGQIGFGRIRDALNAATESVRLGRKPRPIRKRVGAPADAPVGVVFHQYMEVVVGGAHSAWNAAVDELFDSLDVVADDFIKRFGDKTWAEFWALVEAAVKDAKILDDVRKNEILENIRKSASERGMGAETKIGEASVELKEALDTGRAISKAMYYGAAGIAAALLGFGPAEQKRREKREKKDFDEWSDGHPVPGPAGPNP